MRDAWSGIDPAKVWDMHAHLVGTGDSGSGITLHPDMTSLASPVEYSRRVFYLNASCTDTARGSVDRAYVERLLSLQEEMRPGSKLLLFAFDRVYDESGRAVPARTSFHVPDTYARDIARAHPQRLEWAASIHPYARDAIERLRRAKSEGARAVKWLPSAMDIDPASPRCDRFYDALAKNRLALISHAGLERAVIGADEQDYGNPLRLRRALDAGVRVVVAHCASMGEDRDLDKGKNGPYVDSFSLFQRLFEEQKHEKLLFGDISAMPQLGRAGPALATVIERAEWHPRLLNGSDYPLPGVMPIFSMDALVSLQLLPASAAPVLKEIRGYNPLLFDFVLKRTLRSRGKALSARIFETRGFFAQ